MKTFLTILLFAVSISVTAQQQQITVDSLASVIKTMQQQIALLQKVDTITFAPAQMTLTTTRPTNKLLTINNYAQFLTAAGGDVTVLTAQLTAAIVRITALETKVTALQAKVTALKATSTTTTVIQ